tara:strand:+ start:2713 stop:3213 length:501 start_codon:yes stop_codon:yes gene_type:complete
MAVSAAVKVRRDGTLVLESGGGSPVTLTVTYEDGNFSANTLGANEDRIVIRDRGSIVGLRKGDDQVGTVGFSVHYREFTNAGAGVLLDFINGTQAGSALNTAGGPGFEQFLCKITFTTEGTDNGDNADGQAIFNSVLLTADFSEGDPDVLNVQGEVYGAITYTGQS